MPLRLCHTCALNVPDPFSVPPVNVLFQQLGGPPLPPLCLRTESLLNTQHDHRRSCRPYLSLQDRGPESEFLGTLAFHAVLGFWLISAPCEAVSFEEADILIFRCTLIS